ncbi:MAG: hypothetical protein A2W19_12030 [Spirochaetes bacterium RBG_16_49_21]|nr:MAG: hypothetical protein A2W19_12030 [Spirochaetes bacterium RBG_16_49_21]
MNYRKLIILPIYNQERFIRKSVSSLKDIGNDILLVDDGSTDSTFNVIKDLSWMKYIKHEQNLGSGASFITAYEYARDLDYEIMITLDHRNVRYEEEISQLMDNITYGYDIVNSSRILENFDYQDISPSYIETTEDLSVSIKDITGFDLTDPLSGIKAIRTESLRNMELTEFNHGLFLQLWIQAHYFGLSLIEIPARSGYGFGEELTVYPDPLGLFMSIIEAEKYLYNRKGVDN